MTFRDRVLASWLAGGALALFAANIYIRWHERAPQQMRLSTDGLERTLRRLSQTQGCASENL